MNRKGMTLIEVILAIMLIGIISIAFLPSISSGYSMLARTKKFTIDSFEAQEEVEILMEEARNLQDINKQEEIKVFGKEIKGYKIKKDISTHGKINVFVANIRPPEPEVPVVENVKIKGMKNGGEIKYIYGADKDVYLEGIYDIKPETSQYLLNVIQKWYFSETGFNPTIPETYPEIEGGVKYPVFPNSYELINGESTKKLTNLSNYFDRHIIYTVTPISKIGKYGEEENSNSLYIIGLPVIDGAALHLDISTAEGENGKLLEWEDMSGNGNNVKAKNNSDNKAPEIKYEDSVKYLDFRDSIMFTNKPIILSNNITIFAVIKNTGNNASNHQNIVSQIDNKKGFILEMNSNQLIFGTRFGTGNNNYEEISFDDIGNEKNIFTAQATDSSLSIYKNSEMKVKKQVNYNNFNNTGVKIQIGDDSSKQNIYEIIIFNRALSQVELEEVEKYLSIKHNIQIYD